MVIIFYYSYGAPRKAAHYGQGSGKILITYLACDGDESNLEECDHRRNHYASYCRHNRDVGVRCCKCFVFFCFVFLFF